MLTRRRFHKVGLVLTALFICGRSRAQLQDTVTVRVRADETVRGVLQPIEASNLTIDNPTIPKRRKNLPRESPPGRAAPIILIIVGAIAVTELLKMIRELYRQTYYGGVLIDNRTQPPTITSDPAIPASMVFVIDHDGKTSEFTSDQFDLRRTQNCIEVEIMLRATIFIAILLMGAISASPAAVAQASASSEDPLLHGHALLIGNAHYSDGHWAQLVDIPFQLERLQEGLQPHFDTVDVEKDLDAAKLKGTIEDFLKRYGNDENSRLFIYYAGHGYSELIRDRNELRGYITGIDTPSNRRKHASI